MNKLQKVILAVGAVVLITAVLFPTWSVRLNGVEVYTVRMSLYSEGLVVYEHRFGEGSAKSLRNFSKVVEPDYRRMVVEVVVITLLTVGGLFVSRKPDF